MNEPQRPGLARRRTRVGSVGVGYLGVSWLILQIVDVIGDIVAFPTWLAPGVLVVLGVGFVFVTATAWIQANPDTTRREQSGELPGDWQLAPKEAMAALSRGQLPHLTWGRTLLGGVVALSLLFGASGVYVLATNRSAGRAADAESGAVRVATMPFTTSGADLEVYREGMVELLATNLDGLGDIRSIASRTVLARWDELGTDVRPDLTTVLETARTTGASHALVGSIVAAGSTVRLTARLFDLTDGDELPVPAAEGPADDILELVDGLSISVVRALLGSEEGVDAEGSRLASLTTSSVPALRLYLEAEAHYRRADFDKAIPLLERAIEADPTFGLAMMRRAQALGWLPAGYPADTIAAARRAIAPLLDGMSQRDATLAKAGIVAFANRDAEGVRLLREFVTRYPDDAEGRFQLADFMLHLNAIRGGTQAEVLGGFDKAVELGPRFAPYYIHALEGAILRGDSMRTRALLDQYRTLAGEDERWVQSSLAFRLLFQGDSVSAADAAQVFSAGLLRLSTTSAMPQVVADLTARYFEPTDMRRLRAWMRAGRWSAIREASAGFPAAIRDSITVNALRWTGAFGLERVHAKLLVQGAIPSAGPDFWIGDATGALQRLLAARDDGTGADPVLVAHLAERAGNTALAESMYSEESWRDFGPAMVYRLAKLYEATGRPKDARAAYERFLKMWSGADADLPPIVDARAAVQRLSR